MAQGAAHAGPHRRPRRAGRGDLRLENLNAAVDHPGVPFGRAEDTLALVRGGEPAGIADDARHLSRADRRREPDRAAARSAPFIGEIQVADVPGRCEPGTGEINYPAIAKALADIGYRGTVGLEAWASGDDERRCAASGRPSPSPRHHRPDRDRRHWSLPRSEHRPSDS